MMLTGISLSAPLNNLSIQSEKVMLDVGGVGHLQRSKFHVLGIDNG